MTKKTFEITDSKAIRVEAINYNDTPMISLRQMYKTKKAPKDWQIGRQGITIPIEQAADIAKKIAKFAGLDLSEFRVVEPATKEKDDE